jgi:hypothetical protein
MICSASSLDSGIGSTFFFGSTFILGAAYGTLAWTGVLTSYGVG